MGIKKVNRMAVIAFAGAAVALAAADTQQLAAQKGKPPTEPPAIATFDNAVGDRITIDNATLPASGTLQSAGDAGQFLFQLPASGRNKRYLTFTYPGEAFVSTTCDPPGFATSPSGSTGINAYGAWVAVRSLAHLQIGEARAVVVHFGAPGGQFLWMGETNAGHGCTNFVGAYRVDQRTWRVSTSLDRLNIPADGAYHGVVGAQIYEGGCRSLTGCLPPVLVTPGSQTVFKPTAGSFDRHYNMPWGVTIYCETCPPPPACATWPVPGQPCQFWHN